MKVISLKTELKDFQVETVDWMIEHEKKYDGGLLLSSAGSGKSICILSTIIKQSGKTLIICPAGVIDNWTQEIEKHTNISRLEVFKYYGNERNNKEIKDKHLIFITSYSIVAREFIGLKDAFKKNSIFHKLEFSRIVLDESHYIRNMYTSVSKAIHSLGENSNMNTKKWIVTATPIFNSELDLFSYFKFLQLEGIDTKADWNNTISKSIDGFERLNKWIEKYSISFKKEDVLKDLPSKNEQTILLQFEKDEQEFYDALKEYSISRMKSIVKKMDKLDKSIYAKGDMKKILHSHVMVYILRLKQACNSPLLVLKSMTRLENTHSIKNATAKLVFFNTSKESKDEECPICYDEKADKIAVPCGHRCCDKCWNKMFNINIYNCPKCREYVEEIQDVEEIEEIKNNSEINNEITTSCKIKKVLELVKKVINNNEKIVIVSQWISMLSIIQDVFNKDPELSDIKYITLQGNIPMEERTESIKQFETKKEIKLCFISLLSSSEGFSIVAANHVCMIDQWWTSAKMIQVMNRCHRITQTKQVYIYKLQVEDSIEQKIEMMVNKKTKISNLILDKWNITDKKSYNSDWMRNIIKLIEKPQEEEITQQIPN